MVLNYYNNKTEEIVSLFKDEFKGKILDIGCNEGNIYNVLTRGGGRTLI